MFIFCVKVNKIETFSFQMNNKNIYNDMKTNILVIFSNINKMNIHSII